MTKLGKCPLEIGQEIYFVLPDDRVICAKVFEVQPAHGRARWAALAADDRMSYSTKDLPYFFNAMRAEGYVMKKRLVHALEKHPYLEKNKEGALLPWVAEHLIEQGALFPPCSSGRRCLQLTWTRESPRSRNGWCAV